MENRLRQTFRKPQTNKIKNNPIITMCTTAINGIATPMVTLLRQLAKMDVEAGENEFETTPSQKAFKVFLYNLDLVNLLGNEDNEEEHSKKAVTAIQNIVSLSLSTLIDILNKPGSNIDKTNMDEVANKSYQDAVAILSKRGMFEIKNDLIIARGIICS